MRSSIDIRLRIDGQAHPETFLRRLGALGFPICAFAQLVQRRGGVVCVGGGAFPEHFLAHYDNAVIVWDGRELNRNLLVHGPDSGRWRLEKENHAERGFQWNERTLFEVEASSIPQLPAKVEPDSRSIHAIIALKIGGKFAARCLLENNRMIWPCCWVHMAESIDHMDAFVLLHFGLLSLFRFNPIGFEMSAIECGEVANCISSGFPIASSEMAEDILSAEENRICSNVFGALPKFCIT